MMHWVALVILVIVVLVYVLVGGAVFMALEKDNEINMTEVAHATFRNFIGKVGLVYGDFICSVHTVNNFHFPITNGKFCNCN